MPQLPFDDTIMFMGILGDATTGFDIFIEWLMTGINHHASEALVDAVFAKLKGIAMIKVDSDWDCREAHRCFDKFFQVDRVSVPASTFGNLKHDRRLFLFTSLDDCLQEFHIIDVKGPVGVLPLKRF